MRPWMAQRPAQGRTGDQASMGPRPCGRGWCAVGERLHLGVKLQWGHGLAAVDGTSDQFGMEPSAELQWGHGLAAVDGRGGRAALAELAELQWGHGLAAVDGADGRADTFCTGKLQWGHGLAAVDGWLVKTSPSRPCSFNGATALRPWMVGTACAL